MSKIMSPRLIEANDFGWVHALNQDNKRELSSLTAEGFSSLVGIAHSVWVIEPEAAFLVLFDETAPYDNPNFAWLRARYDRFLYIDRIAVAAHAKRQGHGRTLYQHAMAVAKAAGLPRVVCEINAEPPNPASDAFHEALGFGVVGEQHLETHGKTVRYWALDL